MPGNKTKVIVDADALIGLIHQDDELHERCLEIFKEIAKRRITPVIPYPIVLEAATALARDKTIRRPDLAERLLKDYAELKQEPTNTEGIKELVAKLYSQRTSRKNSPFDHYVLAVARINEIDVVFSFDQFYPRQGLKLAADWIKKVG